MLAVAVIATGQCKSATRAKVPTVCEALDNLNQLAGTAIVIVGRMEKSVDLIDHYEFLAHDGCEHPVITGGHVWSNRILIAAAWDPGLPKAPVDRPVLNYGDVAAKLSAVRKTTPLGFHDEPQVETTGGSTKVSTAHVPNEWAVVYGRIVRHPNLDKDCGAEGCGGFFNVPAIIVVEPYNVRRLRDDRTLLPDSSQ